MESPSTNSKIQLANDINSAFLEPLQSYPKLSPSSKIEVTNHRIPKVSIESVERKLRTIKESKAPGPDEIPNWFLKSFSHLLAEPVCYLINSSFQKQVLPTIWKKANVIPLPKNKSIEEFNKDLRPISLAEEYVVQEHVKPAVLKHIRPDQYGCVPFSSTKHALIYLIHHWLQATDGTGSEVRVILMDYKKAFDLIDHNLLMCKLESYGINYPYILNWIHDFLSDRKQRVKLENDIFSSWDEVSSGVPQGSKLGPWLFLVMINDLKIESSDGNAIFVDDTTSFEIVDNHGQSTAQVIVDEISNWSIQNKFQIQPIKSKEMRISFKQAPSIFDDLHINGTTIETVDSFHLLGLTIQNNLKWDKHVERICKKASKRLYFLSQLKRAKVQSRELVEFYVTCIRPVLTYACEVFNFNLQDKLKLSMERIQKRAMRIIHGYDTPYDVALELSSLERLSAYRDNLCDDLLLKVSRNTEDKFHNLLPFNTNRNLPLRNIRKFSVPKCNTDRFKNSFINIAASRYNEFYCK